MKSVRWYIRFISLKGTQYRIDIYDEGTFNPVELYGGANPFTTDEDSSDDYFAPIRTQTGTIEVCTLLPGTTDQYITLEDLLPENNLSRPVRLRNVDDDTIEWQGFLSCETYSQDYTSIPQVLQLRVISVLEAMDSVEVDPTESMAFKKIMGHIAYAMKAVEEKSGMQLFNNLYIPYYYSTAITNKYFYNNVYFSTEDIISGDNITVNVHSISTKEILEQVAKFFGCCWREFGQNIYLEAPGKQNYIYGPFTSVYDSFVTETGSIIWTLASTTTVNIEDLSWMGTDHQRSIMQGAKRIRVNAKLKDFECNMSLDECPVNSLVENPESRQSVNGEVHVNTNETFYNLAEHKHYLTRAIFPTDLSAASLQLIATLPGINYDKTIFWTTDEFREYYYELVVNQTKASSGGLDHYVTSFMSWWRDKEGELQSGLMVCGVPKNLYWSFNPIQGRLWNKYTLTEDNYVFRQQTPLIFAATKGYIKININTLAWSNAPGTMPSIVYGATVYPKLTVAIQFGRYWAYLAGNQYSWDGSFRTIDFPLEHKATDEILKTESNWSSDMGIDEDEGIFIEIPSFMVGFIKVYVYPFIDALCADPYTNGMFDVFITKLDVDYVPPKGELITDRSENVYLKDLGTAFRDEIDVDVELASDANNSKLATMLWESDGITPVKLLTLGSSTQRPEVNLLDRLADYYGSARQRLELITEHPATDTLPMLKLNGISPDNRKYVPLSESRDWKADTCKLTCYETPNNE